MSRLSDILNVPEGQEFKYKSQRLKVVENTIYRFGVDECWKRLTNIRLLEGMIAFPEKIKIIPTKPKLTEQEVTAIKGRIAEGCKWLARDYDGDLWFYKLLPNCNSRFYTSKEGNYFNADNSLYKFVEPGECVYLPDLIKEGEE